MNTNPICPFDLSECNQHSELTLSGCTNFHNCDRGNNGVRATGAMPGAEKIYNAVKKFPHKTEVICWVITLSCIVAIILHLSK